MLELLKKELDNRNALTGPLPDIIHRIAEAIPSQTIADTMKYTIAISEIILYASQFRRNIHHWDGTPVPINSVGFIVAKSGGGKDSSVNAVRKCFATGYTMINDKRKALAKQQAIVLAREAGDVNPTDWETYKSYFRAPNPLFVAPSTTEGFIQHLNDLDNDGIGAGYMYTGEIGAELAGSTLIIENIKVISELYDIGNKEVKVLKARENQSKEIKGLPVSALFQGSPANLLYDESIKKKFKIEFSSKLARRSWFCFCPEEIPEPDYTGKLAIDNMIKEEEQREDQALAAREQISKGINILTEANLTKTGQLLEVDPKVRRLFIIYKRYNTEVSNHIPNLFPMSVLVRRHLQWKALKLSGAIAIFNQHETITEEDFVLAIRFCELLDKDLMKFESELVKEPYELFADYMKSISVDGQAELGLHSLRKMCYIPMAGDPKKKMKELVHLAAAYDLKGIYKVDDTGITYEGVVETDVLGISFKPIDNTELFKAIEDKKSKDEITRQKTRIASTANYGLEVADTTFSELSTMLKGDFAYSPFKFKDGVRNKDGIISGTKWVVLDIDDSTITAEQCDFMLQDINHHIALSSNKDNQFKFRVLIELDANVEVNSIIWKHFYRAIAKDLALKVDPLPQSQIFFSYSGRPVYSVIDADPLPVRDFLMEAIERADAKPAIEKRLTSPQKHALLSDELTTFGSAFEATNGSGSREMIKAAYYAKDLGRTNEEIIELIHRINGYWDQSMNKERLEKTILSQIERWN